MLMGMLGIVEGNGKSRRSCYRKVRAVLSARIGRFQIIAASALHEERTSPTFAAKIRCQMEKARSAEGNKSVGPLKGCRNASNSNDGTKFSTTRFSSSTPKPAMVTVNATAFLDIGEPRSIGGSLETLNLRIYFTETYILGDGVDLSRFRFLRVQTL